MQDRERAAAISAYIDLLIEEVEIVKELVAMDDDEADYDEAA